MDYRTARSLLDYHKDGYLINKIRRGRSKVGDKAGGDHTDTGGYNHIKVKGIIYLAHRLIYLWHYGYFPELSIDHIDRVKTNNRIENLREVSHSCNIRNTRLQVNNTSGVRGVSWCNSDQRWVVQIGTGKKRIRVGCYKSKEEAIKSRREAELLYSYPDCSGDN